MFSYNILTSQWPHPHEPRHYIRGHRTALFHSVKTHFLQNLHCQRMPGRSPLIGMTTILWARRTENMELTLHVEMVKNYNCIDPGDQTACSVGYPAGNCETLRLSITTEYEQTLDLELLVCSWKLRKSSTRIPTTAEASILCNNNLYAWRIHNKRHYPDQQRKQQLRKTL